jgi:hypothetical protein
MPNDRHWSVSMLLEWVLTRDIETVQSMADEYGGWLFDDEGPARFRPPTLDDVLLAHTIDKSLPKDEQAREVVRRANSYVTPARQEIFDALRSGVIDGWARPNGSGDIVKIDPIQWAGLRFRAVNGHDIALPVDSEGDPLSLLRPLADYLAGTVPGNITPTVWPDPVFLAERAMNRWPANRSIELRGQDLGAVAATTSRPTADQDASERLTPQEVTQRGAEADEPWSGDGGGIAVPYRTGLAGRPTAWSLIEAECRRRYALGERRGTRAEWGRVLIKWLQSKHAGAPAVQQKTLTNKLSGLLRELEANEVPRADRRRPK